MKTIRNANGISFFDKYLTIWVFLCMVVGVAIGKLFPKIPNFISRFEVANVNIIIAILIWLMIYPMMLKIDFTSIKNVGKNPKGLFITWIVNWLIKPFMMFALASLFFLIIYKNILPVDIAREYLAGAVLLGAAPCTAMVFVWSSLTKGKAAYTLVQVATNDLIILVLYVPIVALQLGIGGFTIPWTTLFLSVVLFVVVPLVFGTITRTLVIKKKGLEYLNTKIIAKLSKVTVFGLLLTLIIIFSTQADLIWNNPLHILLIAIPLIIQTFVIFFISYGSCRIAKLPFTISAPAGFIGASNFFELAVAVAIALFPLNPGVALATIVGVLTEVPVMLMLVKIANKTQHWFPKENNA
ncbi:MAG: ACR3 family arsenite efflux transporter [Candidatus Izemoplasmatales bacterium]|nr:ACR3 family arsenite efflux transporter [Candidatus Izemoplasmatales bacterium]MDD3865665.1 ACR3 family arsenite efflux transporter [Candidatus Izemoplasmatales bacterium]